MKKSYLKLYIFELLIFIFFIINSFVSSILKNYSTIIFLIILLVLFKLIFGFEKDRHRYTKDLIFDIIIFLLIYFLCYYLFGIIIGFAKTGNYYSLYGLKNFIIPTVLIILLKEYLRYMVVVKSDNNKILLVITCVLFSFLDVTTALSQVNFNNYYNVFVFVALSLLPAISNNILCTYIALKSGYKPNILYLLVMNLYGYLLPIVPNPNEYIKSIIELIIPILLLWRITVFFNKEKDEIIRRDYKKKNEFLLILPTLVIIVIVYFICGYFKYYALAIATGSMEPNIKKGDVVIVEKVDKIYNDIKVGDVIAFKHNNIVIVHRVIKKINSKDGYYFYTKGDANSNADDYKISEEMIVGIVNIKIPFIGYPTVLLSEL